MAITTTTIVAANDNIYLYRTGIWTTTVYDDDEGRGRKERDDEQGSLRSVFFFFRNFHILTDHFYTYIRFYNFLKAPGGFRLGRNK